MRHLDKAHHFFWSLGLAVLASFLVGLIPGVAIAAALGIAKETWDGASGRWCWWDIAAANAAGLLAAVIVIGG